MVCLACLLPLFLIPVINALPLLFDFILAKLYRLLGWEYKKPERVPPACPYKPPTTSNNMDNTKVNQEPSAPSQISNAGSVENDKRD